MPAPPLPSTNSSEIRDWVPVAMPSDPNPRTRPFRTSVPLELRASTPIEEPAPAEQPAGIGHAPRIVKPLRSRVMASVDVTTIADVLRSATVRLPVRM